MNREDLLDDAWSKINGDREEEYGDVYNSFTTISMGWDIITKNALATHGCVSPMHVGLMMDWLKTSRLLVNINHEDSWIDKIGYSALSAEVADEYNDRVEEVGEDEDKSLEELSSGGSTRRSGGGGRDRGRASCLGWYNSRCGNKEMGE
jgi:hypothetical protein